MSSEHIKSRVISVHEMDRPTCVECKIGFRLKLVPGVISARLDDDEDKLYIVYDLEMTDYEHIEAVLESAGCSPDDSVWQELKSSFIRFAEENERAHLAAGAKQYSYSPMEELDDLLEDMED